MGSDNQPHNPDTEHLYPTQIPSYSLATNPSASSPGIPLHTTESTTGSSVLEFHVSGAMQLYSWILYSTRYCRDSPILLCVSVAYSFSLPSGTPLRDTPQSGNPCICC